MSDSIYIRLSHIMDDLARLARHVEPPHIQLALEHLVDRLDGIVEETIGLETPVVLDLDPDVRREEEP